MVAYGSRTAHSNLYHTWASVKTTDFHSWQVSAVVRPGKMWAEGAQTPIWIRIAKVVSMPVPERCSEMLGGFKHGLIFPWELGSNWLSVGILLRFSKSTSDQTLFGFPIQLMLSLLGWVAQPVGSQCSGWPAYGLKTCVRSGEMAALTPIWPIWQWESPTTVPKISEECLTWGLICMPKVVHISMAFHGCIYIILYLYLLYVYIYICVCDGCVYLWHQEIQTRCGGTCFNHFQSYVNPIMNNGVLGGPADVSSSWLVSARPLCQPCASLGGHQLIDIVYERLWKKFKLL